MKYLKSTALTAISITLFLGACAPTAERSLKAHTASIQSADKSEKLGTKWGDEISSHVSTVDLKRTSSEPISQHQLYYANKNYRGNSLLSMSLASGVVDLSVKSNNHPLIIKRSQGNYYVQGQEGLAYKLIYRNNSNSQSYEIVTSVDGLNVISGQKASRHGNGYVLAPRSSLVVDGFRKSQSAVASFIFSKPQNSYANHTTEGSVNNTGVIGTAIYKLHKQHHQTNTPQAFPADNGYAPAPQ